MIPQLPNLFREMKQKTSSISETRGNLILYKNYDNLIIKFYPSNLGT